MQTVLIDTGYGGKYPPLDRKAYRMEEGNPCVDSLARVDVAPNEVDFVLFSHLHFDHAGGATSFDSDRRLVPTFRNAKYFVGRWEWEDAISGKPELISAYPQNNLLPLRDAGVVELFGSDAQILPGLRAVRTGGHTRGHTAFVFESKNGKESVLFIGDLCATNAHMRLLWSLSYDTFLLVGRRKKKELLTEAAGKKSWIVFAHDPFVSACRIETHPQKEFVIVEAIPKVAQDSATS